MTRPTLSVVVPTRARPLELRRALASVEAQRLEPDEVVVVPDEAGRGVSAARNQGVARSTGDVIAFLDDDDAWRPDYLESAVALLVREAVDVVCTDLLLVRPGEPPRPGKPAPEALRPADFHTRNPGLGGSNTLIRRETFETVGGFDETLPTLNDMDFGLRLALGAPRYAPLHRPLVIYHHHGGPRLSVPGSPARRAGLLRFHSLHGHRMSAADRTRFHERMVREGVDPDTIREGP